MHSSLALGSETFGGSDTSAVLWGVVDLWRERGGRSGGGGTGERPRIGLVAGVRQCFWVGDTSGDTAVLIPPRVRAMPCWGVRGGVVRDGDVVASRP